MLVYTVAVGITVGPIENSIANAQEHPVMRISRDIHDPATKACGS
jgi:hypothetical protein